MSSSSKQQSPPKTNKPKLVIFDFDGTIMDTLEAITIAFHRSFEVLLPGTPISEDALHYQISLGQPAAATFKALWPAAQLASFDAEKCILTFRAMYSAHGFHLQKLFPQAEMVLRAVAERGIALAIVSNKNIRVIKETMQAHKLTDLVSEELIVGAPMYGNDRKPHPASYTDILLPRLKRKYGAIFEHHKGDVLMVGDTVADVHFAHNIGAKMVWCAYGDGNKKDCRDLKPEFSIKQLSDVLAVIDAM